MLRCGKFKGQTHEHVKKLDKGYCAWVLRAQREKQPLPRDLRKFADHLATQHGGVLTVGIHKGTFFDEVLVKHPDYGAWAAELRQPGDGMKHFAQYVVDRRRAEEKRKREEQARSETAEDRKNCCVCYCQPSACAFVLGPPCKSSPSRVASCQTPIVRGRPLSNRYRAATSSPAASAPGRWRKTGVPSAARRSR